MYRCIAAIILSLSIVACGGKGDRPPNPNAPPSPGTLPPGGLERFTTFESGQVRPLALSPDGSRLFATNTPNGTLEIYDVQPAGLTRAFSVAVGLEPVAVAVFDNNTVWVVNHLSDSISVVDVASSPPQVVRTLLVGDEPRDIVFAGNNKKFALITTAHRGQNGPNDSPVDAQLFTPAVGRADVWVFDTGNLGNSLGGTPIKVINLFADTPRALTVTPDGNTVYVATFNSGNQTTAIGEQNPPLAKPGITANHQGLTQPSTGLIVRFDGSNWLDEQGNIWDAEVKLNLPDYDVFTIDTSGNDPVKLDGQRFSGVGTTLFNMLVNPANGDVYVSNTEARNEVRFEGVRNANTNASSVRGHFVESRITVISNGQVTPIHLNNHINYDQVSDAATRNLSIAQPMAMVIAGNNLYVAGFGSQKIAFYDTRQLDPNILPNANNQISLSAGGPTGMVIDNSNNRIYVLTRFDNGISTINLGNNTESAHITMRNPEPAEVINGRPFLYDAQLTSNHGDSSCGLCHVFGDMDALSWDLGDPDGDQVSNPNDFVSVTVLGQQVDLRPNTPPVFHPMKGPMATQSLRGMKHNGPLHWRGDRTGVSGTANDPLEVRAFMDFNVAFVGLVGRENELTETQMRSFAEFAMELTYPPNPIRALDNGLTNSQEEGRRIYFEEATTGVVLQCNTCHVLDPINNRFGTGGLSTVEGPDVSQEFKVPHLRNMYQKVGKFGNSGGFGVPTLTPQDQVRGFGFMHDGAMDTLDNFLSNQVFLFDANPDANTTMRRQVVEFVMAFDSDLYPIVGQQVTLTANSGQDVIGRIDLLRQRAAIINPRRECDLIVKGNINGAARGAVMLSNGDYQLDSRDEASVMTHAQLSGLIGNTSTALTFTCVPPGSGIWMGIDADDDGIYDFDES